MSGTQLKLAGIEKVKRHNERWMELAAWEVEHVSNLFGGFTIDDVRHYCSCPPSHPNAWGALLNTLARQGKIQRVGYRPSVLPSTHGRIVSVWKGVQ